MRIGLVTATYSPSVVNGAVRMVGLYRRFLEELGHEVTIFTLGHGDSGTDPGTFRSPGIPIGNHGYYLASGYVPAAQEAITQMDIVHCHHLLMGLEFAHRYANCPIAYTNHTRYDLYTSAYTPLPQAAADGLMRVLWPKLASLADAVIAPSESLRRVMLGFGVPEPIRVIENGIDLEPFLRPRRAFTKANFGLKESAQLLVFVGRLSSEKRVDILLKQFALARRARHGLNLALFGAGPQELDLRSLVRAHDLESAVQFRGLVPYDDVGAWLSAADGFVTASISEVHPLAVIEAMATGLPVIACHSPGIDDLVTDGINGLVTEPTGSELGQAMIKLTEDPRQARRMGEVSRAAARAYDIRRTVAATVGLYEELLAARPDRTRRHRHGRTKDRGKRPGFSGTRLARAFRSPATGRQMEVPD